MRTNIKVKQQPGAEFITAEVLATSIREISRGVKAMLKTGLKREAIVVLLADSTKVSRVDIRSVLAGLESLEHDWCDPAK